MRKFLKNILCFSLPLLIVLVFGLLLSFQILNLKFSAELPKVHYIFLGHSQPEGAIDDTYIANSKNLSQGGEAYFYTYQKLKKIIKDNKELKTVFVSFSNNQIEKKMDNWAFDDIHLNQYYSKYSFLMDPQEIFLVAKKNPSYFAQANLASLENNWKTIIKRKNLTDNRNWGGYLLITKTKLDSLKKVNYIGKLKKDHNNELSETSLHYLKKIVNLCKANDKEVVFIRTPYDQDLLKVYDEALFQKIRKNQFPDIPFWDFRDTAISKSGFLDYDHLNQKGAKEFSEILEKRILIFEKTGK